MRGTILLFVKAPLAGRVKTRLARDVGYGRAAAIFRILMNHTIREAEKSGFRVMLAVDPASVAHPAARFWPAHLPRVAQGEGDLGVRMGRAFERAPHGPVVIIGADAPGLRARHFRQAFAALAGADAVFGPAADGGYWLVGLKRRKPARGLFDGVRWSSEYALSDTLNSLPADFGVRLLETLCDVDEAKDLASIGAYASAH